MSNSSPEWVKLKKKQEAKLARERRRKAGQARPTRLAGITLGAATLVGGLVALITMLPRVTPTISDPVNPSDPFSSSITTTNTGYLPLRAVRANFSVGEVVWQGPKGLVRWVGDEANQEWRWKDWGAHDLGPDDRFTVTLNDPLTLNGNAFVSAHLAVVITYEIPFLHFHRKKLFPMFAKRQTNGYFYWYSDTLRPKT